MPQHTFTFFQDKPNQNKAITSVGLKKRKSHLHAQEFENERISSPRPRKRKSNKHKAPPNGCQECGAMESPVWRKGTEDTITLCNACGLRYAKNLKNRVSEVFPSGYKMQISFLLSNDTVAPPPSNTHLFKDITDPVPPPGCKL